MPATHPATLELDFDKVRDVDGRLKLIATGFAESAIAVAQAIHEIRPETKIQPKYSTNTGVQGVVAGQP